MKQEINMNIIVKKKMVHLTVENHKHISIHVAKYGGTKEGLTNQIIADFFKKTKL